MYAYRLRRQDSSLHISLPLLSLLRKTSEDAPEHKEGLLRPLRSLEVLFDHAELRFEPI